MEKHSVPNDNVDHDVDGNVAKDIILHFECLPVACPAPRSDSTLRETVDDFDEARGGVGPAP